jgi:ammonia channel protein AmtB
MALLGSPLCYLAMFYKNPSQLDDAMDSFAIHGVGGVLGSLLTGIFANDDVTGDEHARGAVNGHWMQVAYQLCGVCAVAAWSLSMTLLILCFLDRALIYLAGEPYRLAAGGDEQLRGLDKSEHAQLQDSDTKPDEKEADAPKLADVVIIPDARLERALEADQPVAEARPARQACPV